jgi:hypothetical protein
MLLVCLSGLSVWSICLVYLVCLVDLVVCYQIDKTDIFYQTDRFGHSFALSLTVRLPAGARLQRRRHDTRPIQRPLGCGHERQHLSIRNMVPP